MTDEAKKHNPEHYQQVAAMLHRRAELSTIPHEKSQILGLAQLAEGMAKKHQSLQRKAQNAPHGAAIEADGGIVPPKKGEEQSDGR